jgi:hypothetical protein
MKRTIQPIAERTRSIKFKEHCEGIVRRWVSAPPGLLSPCSRQPQRPILVFARPVRERARLRGSGQWR